MSLNRILYLHGLEGKAFGPKIDYLRTMGEVLSPTIPYTKDMNFSFFTDLLSFAPEVIIGSSLGAFASYHLALISGVSKAFLFNPVFSLAAKHISLPDYEPKKVGSMIAILGVKDPYHEGILASIQTLAFQPNIILEPELEHRIPYEMFVKHVNPKSLCIG